jgi:formylglycine-generating enzyme required for sulfatase activity
MELLRLLPPFILVPAGPFLIGTPERDLSGLAKAYGGTRESYREESPQHMLTLAAFEIAQVPVTNALYMPFVAATGAHPPISWRGATPPEHLADHPVVDVSWADANTFCEWLSRELATANHQPATTDQELESSVVGRQSSVVFRLPSEAEWERAARGTDGRTFPWGNIWDASRANTRDGGRGGTSPIGAYAGGASPAGCLDMAGNVWQWTASLDALYPYLPGDGREDPGAPGRRILRGGCYANPYGYARCACRFRLAPMVRNEFLGFRLARNA